MTKTTSTPEQRQAAAQRQAAVKARRIERVADCREHAARLRELVIQNFNTADTASLAEALDLLSEIRVKLDLIARP